MNKEHEDEERSRYNNNSVKQRVRHLTERLKRSTKKLEIILIPIT